MILTAFRRSVHEHKIHALYGMIVAQARSGVLLYAITGYADTLKADSSCSSCTWSSCCAVLVDILKHPNFQRPCGDAEPPSQLLFDAFCRDLDANLREMGVGDMGVPRRMRRFGEEFYGRQAAYQAALETLIDRAA